MNLRAIVLGLALSLAAAPLQSQQAALTKTNVVSANPFGLLLDLFNAEWEHKVSESATAGVGGSTVTNSGSRYLNADAFYRFYPGGEPLRGWAFGVKAGITTLSGRSPLFGVGFDLNRSWVLGRNQNFYVGVGFGLKRLYGTQAGDLTFIPTFRIVNVGFAF